MLKDENVGCSIASGHGDTGIMNKEAFEPNYALNGWSSCSISQFETYYNDNNHLTCLTDNAHSYYQL